MRETALILVIDLEATCADDDSIPAEQMEVIEVGAVWATQEGQVLDRFQTLVRPILRPQLTQFCIQLVGIQQAEIDLAEPFPAAASALAKFANLHQNTRAVWMSWGQYDRKQIERECVRHGIGNPLGLEHQNAKRLFAKAQKIGKEIGMAKACELAQLKLKGTHHRGLDDACNIARLLPWALGLRDLRQKGEGTEC